MNGDESKLNDQLFASRRIWRGGGGLLRHAC